MSAGSLLYARLNNNAVGVAARVSPDLRPPGNVLPCIVYTIEQNAPLASLSKSTVRYLARCRLTIIAATVASADTIAASVMVRLHGESWTSGASTAYSCVVQDSTSGLVEDGEPGGLDLDRTVTMNIDLYHS